MVWRELKLGRCHRLLVQCEERGLKAIADVKDELFKSVLPKDRDVVFKSTSHRKDVKKALKKMSKDEPIDLACKPGPLQLSSVEFRSCSGPSLFKPLLTFLTETAS